MHAPPRALLPGRLPARPPACLPWRSCRSGIDPAPPKQGKGAERYVGDLSTAGGVGWKWGGGGEEILVAFDAGGRAEWTAVALVALGDQRRFAEAGVFIPPPP